MSSDYVVDKEIAIIRERQAKGEDVHFYPLLLTPTPESRSTSCVDKNLRPRDGKPFSSYSPTTALQHMSDAADEILRDRGGDRRPQKRGEYRSLPPASAPTARACSSPSPLPPDPNMIGRADRREELVAAILGQERPIVVPGALGMGKTTLALAAAYDPASSRASARIGGSSSTSSPSPTPRASCARSPTARPSDTAGAAREVEAKIADFCAVGPTLAILDNFETPWRKEKASTETVLGRLAAIKGLRLDRDGARRAAFTFPAAA